MSKIKWERYEEGILPVYCKYDGQYKHQPAFLYLTEDGKAGFDYNPVIGGGLMDVWLGRMLTWDISPYLTTSQIDDIVEDEEVNYLLEKIHSGHTVEWDGHNWRGSLTDEAEDASIYLQELLYGIYGEGIVIEDPRDSTGLGNSLIDLFIDGGYASIEEFYAEEFSDGGFDGETVYDFDEDYLKEKLVEELEYEIDYDPDAWKKWPYALKRLADENGLIQNEE